MHDEVLIPRSRAALWVGLCAAAAVRGCSCAAVAVFCALAPAARSAVVAPVPAAAPASTAAQSYPYVAGFTYVKSLDRIEEYRLDSNGLSVLLVPDHSAPVVTFQVTYRVGSRNEVTGTTGSTHLLEHLMFKGSDGFNDPKGNSVKQYLERVGGQFNASTSVDRTNYFATVGRDNLAGYVAIEADRMRHLWLHEADRQAEMTVVRNEYERGKNDPVNVLIEEVTAAAYVALPYHHPTIGWKSDIEHVPIEKLREFYDTFYWPNNATVTVVGDIDPAAALNLIKKYYGVIPRSPAPIPGMYTEEPAQSGARRVIIKRPGELGTVIIAHKVPNGRDADQPALDMLDAILSSGKNARLYRALVDAGLALNAGAGTDLHHDLSLHSVYAVLAPGATHEQVEKTLLEEIDKIKTGGVTAAEVERVKQQYIAADAYKRDGTAAVAAELNEWIAVGDWTLYVTFPQKVQQVTPADVQRVAKEYLNEDQSTTGWFIPMPPGGKGS
jgi:zinc protease